MRRVQKFLLRIVQNRVFQHILFWCISYYFLLHYFSITNQIELIDYVYTSVFHLTIMAAVYINLALLIPRVLGKGRYLLYGLLVTALLASAAWLNQFSFNHAIDYFLSDYFFISGYTFGELVLFMFIYLSITTLLKFSKAWFRLQDSKHQIILMEKEQVNTELLFLRSQINPHFLFNSLNNVYSLTLKKDDKAPEVVLKLSSVLRYMIYECNEAYVPLHKEIDYLNNYIQLQLLRIRDASSIRFQVDGEVNDQVVAPLIFIVFIENSFKHGVKATIDNPYIDIHLQVTETQLSFTVKNSKGKTADAVAEPFSGVGLENVKRRLSLLYPDSHTLDVQDSDDWHQVALTLLPDKANRSAKTSTQKQKASR